MTTLDPARGMFTGGNTANANFPQASGGQLDDARALYALLTGRVTAVTGQIALDPETNKYVSLGPRTRQGKIDMYSGYVQDTWRMTPTITLTGGVRWDVQLPFAAVNDVMTSVTMADLCGMSGLGDGGVYSRCNFTALGVQPGSKVPEFQQLTDGTQGYNTDWNNFAPSAQIAWRPNVQSGFLRTLLGDPEQATVRAGYSQAYERQGMAVFTDLYGANPGSVISYLAHREQRPRRPRDLAGVSQPDRTAPDRAVQRGTQLPDRDQAEPSGRSEWLRA